jgi:hypothetical protein
MLTCYYKVYCKLPRRPPIVGGELRKALKRLNNNKASRVDGIAAETLKLAIYAPDDSPFGKSLLELMNNIWTTKCVPKQWCSFAVVSILRKGDVTVMDTHRGISSMGAII